jgi:hypothetical protein
MASFTPTRWECLPLDDLDKLLDELDSSIPIDKLRAAAFNFFLPVILQRKLLKFDVLSCDGLYVHR